MSTYFMPGIVFFSIPNNRSVIIVMAVIMAVTEKRGLGELWDRTGSTTELGSQGWVGARLSQSRGLPAGQQWQASHRALMYTAPIWGHAWRAAEHLILQPHWERSVLKHNIQF